MKNTKSYIVVIVIVIVWFIYSKIRDDHRNENWDLVNAEVASSKLYKGELYESKEQRRNKSCLYKVNYTHNEVIYNDIRLRILNKVCEYKEGQVVDILVDPANPNNIQLK